MNPTLFKAVGVVTCALVFYSIAIISEQKNHTVSRRVLGFLLAGVIFDIGSTCLMIAGSGNIPITVHGFIGYSALIVMLTDTVLIWRFWARNRVKVTDSGTLTGVAPDIPPRLHRYTRAAYSWWVIAYIAGAVIAVTLGS
jgi:hypothetical protein